MKAAIKGSLGIILLGGFISIFFNPGQSVVKTDSTRPSSFQERDLDRDGAMEEYYLKDHRLVIREAGQLLWESPPGWQVDLCILADANNDHQEEIVLVVWKRGSFDGPKPFWDQDADGQMRNHLFLFGLARDSLKPLWLSSALPRPIARLEVADYNKDGDNELLIHEGSYQGLPGLRAGPARASRPVLMRWREWGFYRLDA